GGGIDPNNRRAGAPLVLVIEPFETEQITNYEDDDEDEFRDAPGGCPGQPSLKLGVAGGAGEGDDVADGGDASQEHQQALKAEAESGVGDGAVTAQVNVPPVILGFEFVEFHVFEELVQALLTLGAADDFADAGNQHVHGGDGLVIVVEPHVEGFYFARII